MREGGRKRGEGGAVAKSGRRTCRQYINRRGEGGREGGRELRIDVGKGVFSNGWKDEGGREGGREGGPRASIDKWTAIPIPRICSY